jgi:cysteine synthase A
MSPVLLGEKAAAHDEGAWARHAIELIQNDQRRSADTHLLRFDAPALDGIDIYLKDESTHPTGSLKHRLARSLFLYGICNGRIRHDTPIIEASSGSTAISESYFARMLGLPFHAVMSASTSQEKVNEIERQHGQCHLVADGKGIYGAAEELAAKLGGVYMDQFTYAERATDWRGNNNIAESIFSQLAHERHPVPTWVVVGAGTGGTSATIGRFIRYRRHDTLLCVVDPENSAFFRGWSEDDPTATGSGSRIEGIGRPRVEPSFLPKVVDAMISVPDGASIAAARWCSSVTGRLVGGSTGTEIWGALRLVAGMRSRGETGSVVTLLCDGGERYAHTYYDDAWLADEGIDIAPYTATLEKFADTGEWVEPSS